MIDTERQKNERLPLNLPLQIKAASGEIIEMELVDLSSDGLRVRGDALSILACEASENGKQVTFEVRISARLAWVEPRRDGDFDLGLRLVE